MYITIQDVTNRLGINKRAYSSVKNKVFLKVMSYRIIHIIFLANYSKMILFKY